MKYSKLNFALALQIRIVWRTENRVYLTQYVFTKTFITENISFVYKVQYPKNLNSLMTKTNLKYTINKYQLFILTYISILKIPWIYIHWRLQFTGNILIN